MCVSSLSSTQGVRRAVPGPSLHLLGGIYPSDESSQGWVLTLPLGASDQRVVDAPKIDAIMQ